MARTKRPEALQNAFSSVNRYEPNRVRVVREKHGDKAASRMKTAIALDEARRNGVKVPRK